METQSILFGTVHVLRVTQVTINSTCAVNSRAETTLLIDNPGKAWSQMHNTRYYDDYYDYTLVVINTLSFLTC